MSSSSNRNNAGASGSGARFAQQHGLQVQPAPPADRVEVQGDKGNDSSSPSSGMSSDGSPGSKERMIICVCYQCALYVMVSKKTFPVCFKCKQPNLVDVLEAAAARDKKRALDAAAARDKKPGQSQ